MLMMYDTEDWNLNPTANSASFLDRQIVTFIYVRTDSFDKSKMQKYVRDKDGVPLKSSKPWVYNHYVPHSRIVKAIEDIIVLNNMTRSETIKWLLNVTDKLKIDPDTQIIQAGDWDASRVAYDVWADWAVSAICDWKENIFYGPGSGDQHGTALDVPDNNTQKERVVKAANKLAKALGLVEPFKSLFLSAVIPAEKLVAKEDLDHSLNLQQADESIQELWQQFIGTKLIQEDAGDKDWKSNDFIESDPEELYNLTSKKWTRGPGENLRSSIGRKQITKTRSKDSESAYKKAKADKIKRNATKGKQGHNQM